MMNTIQSEHKGDIADECELTSVVDVDLGSPAHKHMLLLELNELLVHSVRKREHDAGKMSTGDIKELALDVCPEHAYMQLETAEYVEFKTSVVFIRPYARKLVNDLSQSYVLAVFSVLRKGKTDRLVPKLFTAQRPTFVWHSEHTHRQFFHDSRYNVKKLADFIGNPVRNRHDYWAVENVAIVDPVSAQCDVGDGRLIIPVCGPGVSGDDIKRHIELNMQFPIQSADVPACVIL